MNESDKWKCFFCGKESDYKAGERFYCLEHWESEYLKGKEDIGGKTNDKSSEQ